MIKIFYVSIWYYFLPFIALTGSYLVPAAINAYIASNPTANKAKLITDYNAV